MSDYDMFADIEDNDVDDPDEAQVEFSGISGSGSTCSPQVPATVAPEPAKPIAPVAPSTPESDNQQSCPFCPKSFPTVRGLKTHMTRSHKGSQVPAVPTTSTATPSSSSTVATAGETASSTRGQSFVCSECPSILTTLSGFVKHRAAHKLKEIFKKMPKPSEFTTEALEGVIKEIMADILIEPCYDRSKKIFVQAFIDSQGTEAWWDLVNMISKFICSMVFKTQSKLMPANQFEDHQKGLNTFLNNNDIELQEKLMCVCPTVKISNALAGRLICRIASKLLSKTQVWVLRKLRIAKTQEVPIVTPPAVATMTDQEKKGFLLNLAGLFQDYLKKGQKHTPRHCECLAANFVDGQHPITRAQFLEKKNWFSGEEFCITPSKRASDFFTAIELEIIPQVKVSKGEVTTQNVVEEVIESAALLDHWFFLTNDFLSEDLSLVFMRQLVGPFIRSSLLLEEKKKNRSESRAMRATEFGFRKHLQTNYVEKDVNIEDVE